MKEPLQQDEIRLDLGKIFRALAGKWRLILVCTAAGTAAAFLLALLLTPRYCSGVTFYVRNNAKPAALGSITSADIAASKELVDSYLVILQSEETLQAVIYHAQVNRSAAQVREMIRASAVNSTEFFRVEVTCADPREAEQIANAIGYILPLRIAGILEDASLRIVDGATLPHLPSEPGYGIITAAGFGAGLLLSLAGIVIQAVAEKTIRGPRDLEKVTDLPLLAQPGRSDTHRSQSYRELRSRLSLLLPEKEEALLMGITSAGPVQEKSSVAWNLACSLRRQGKRVILLDCDLQASRLARDRGLEPGRGLADFLAGKCGLDESIRRSYPKCPAMGFPVIPAGNRYARGTELLLSHRMAVVLRFCRKYADYVLLDLPEAGESGEAAELAAGTDGVVLVVQRDKSRTDTLDQTLSRLTFAKAPLLGLVLLNGDPEQ